MGLMELTKAMNARFSDRTEVHRRAQATLGKLLAAVLGHAEHHSSMPICTVAMFPEWMPGSYAVLFSKPLPEVREIAFETVIPHTRRSHTHTLSLLTLVCRTVFLSDECVGHMGSWPMVDGRV